MNWWWLHTLAHLEREKIRFYFIELYFIFKVSLKISPVLSTATAESPLGIQCHAGIWPGFLGKEEVLSSFVTE